MKKINDGQPSSPRARAIIVIKKLVPKLEKLGLTEQIAKAYLAGIPVDTITKQITEERPDHFLNNLKILAGAVRIIIRKTLNEEERKAIEFQHRSHHGYEIAKAGLGIGSLSPEEHSENARKGGVIGGKKNYDNKIGIFGLSKEERISNARKGAFASLKSTGKISWQREIFEEITDLNEHDYCIYLSNQSDFLRPAGKSMAGRPDSKKIADELNKIFHNGAKIRKASQVRIRLCEERKKSDQNNS